MIDCSFSTSKLRRGRAQGDPPGTICPTVTTTGGLAVTEEQKELRKHYRIRKLTPGESFRLMGLTKEDCEKCSNVGISDSQLYKIAGNGLICNVVQYIMEHLYKATIDSDYVCTDEKMIANGYAV